MSVATFGPGHSDFLEDWDWAIQGALKNGVCGCVWTLIDDPDSPYPMPVLSARTMHPAFMAAVPPKYDPERDK